MASSMPSALSEVAVRRLSMKNSSNCYSSKDFCSLMCDFRDYLEDTWKAGSLNSLRYPIFSGFWSVKKIFRRETPLDFVKMKCC